MGFAPPSTAPVRSQTHAADGLKQSLDFVQLAIGAIGAVGTVAGFGAAPTAIAAKIQQMLLPSLAMPAYVAVLTALAWVYAEVMGIVHRTARPSAGRIGTSLITAYVWAHVTHAWLRAMAPTTHGFVFGCLCAAASLVALWMLCVTLKHRRGGDWAERVPLVVGQGVMFAVAFATPRLPGV